jgi:hypothetical protein
MDIVCLQLPYRTKEITTRELTKRKQMRAYIGPTKGAYTVPTKYKGIKMKYKQMGAYTVPTKVSGSHPDFLCTN